MNSDLLADPVTLGISTQAQHDRPATTTRTIRASAAVIDRYRAMVKSLSEELGVPEHAVHSTALALLIEMHWTQVGDLIRDYLEPRTATPPPNPEETQ